MDAQREHDLEMARRKPVSKSSHKRLKAALKKKAGSAPTLGEATDYDPIGQLVEENPGLTREKALEMSEAMGF